MFLDSIVKADNFKQYQAGVKAAAKKQKNVLLKAALYLLLFWMCVLEGINNVDDILHQMKKK